MAAAMAFLPSHRHLLLSLLLLLLPLVPSPSISQPAPSPDARALLQLKNSFTNDAHLTSWTLGNSSNPATAPCDDRSPWAGIVCLQGIIIGLSLNNMGLTGTINVNALARLPGLRTVNLVNNSFSGPMPEFDRLQALRSILISHNRFFGPIDPDFFSGMTRLQTLWIDDNAFTGPIPPSLSDATALTELHMENNHFAGRIPRLPPPALSDFNVSNNGLEGPIPKKYSKFQASSFLGNKALCGKLLIGIPCVRVARPRPNNNGRRDSTAKEDDSSGRLAGLCILALVLICVGMYTIKTHDHNRELAAVRLGKARRAAENEQASSRNPARSKGPQGGGDGGGELVIVNGRKGKFGLADLMKAEAEVMGSGSIGSAYKVIMTNGVTVVVKRVRQLNRVGKEAFDSEMSRLGKLNHPNVLQPLAYNYRKEEKLLVMEFVSKGSLLYLLHGDRGSDHLALDWPTRLKTARGIARGLAYLHAELPLIDVPHGNLKSSNVLLSPTFEPLLTDYGFLTLVNPATAADALFAFRSPEALAGLPVSPRSDVYCLGVIILELLSGKYPTQYLTNEKGGTDVVQWATHAVGEGQPEAFLDPAIVAEAKAAVPEMTRLLSIGLECAEADPDRRLGLKEAEEKMEELVVAEAQRPKQPRSHATYVREGMGARSSRRGGSIGEQSGRRKDDVFSFAMS